MNIEFRLANIDDLQSVLEIFNNATNAMNSKGIYQWDNIYPNAGLYLALFAENKRQDYCRNSDNIIDSCHEKGHIIQKLSKGSFRTARCNAPQHAQYRQKDIRAH